MLLVPYLRSTMSKKPYIPIVDISELPAGEFHDAQVLARDRILLTFSRAKAFYRGKHRGTPTYIVGLGPKQKHLAQHVMEKCRYRPHMHFIGVRQIQALVDDGVSEKIARGIADGMEYQFLLMTIEEMCSSAPPSCEIWYDSGYWSVLPSTMDVFFAHKTKRQFKRDQRNCHGRVRNQAHRHGGATSVGNKRFA